MPLLPRRWYFRAGRAWLYRRLVTVAMGSVMAAGIAITGYLQMPAVDRPTAPPSAVHFRNCDAARAAGAMPIRRGEVGYAPRLDQTTTASPASRYRATTDDDSSPASGAPLRAARL